MGSSESRLLHLSNKKSGSSYDVTHRDGILDTESNIGSQMTPFILFIHIPKGSWCLCLGREKEQQDQGNDIGECKYKVTIGRG
jgi:hypothetical protein